MSKKEKIPTAKELGEQILSEFHRWVEIYEHGCSDPCWEDGVNIGLVRNHIIYAMNLCERVLGDAFWSYPDSYFLPIPKEVPNNFMAVTRKCHYGEVLPANKDKPINEVFKFDWSEVL